MRCNFDVLGQRKQGEQAHGPLRLAEHCVTRESDRAVGRDYQGRSRERSDRTLLHHQ